MPSSPVTRRELLGSGGISIAIGLAGCLESAQDTTTATQQREVTQDMISSSSVTPPQAAEILRRITIAQQDDVPTNPDVALTAAIRSPFVTAEQTAQLRIAFTNTAGHEREFKFGVPPPFSEFWSVQLNGEPVLFLLSLNPKFEKTASDCWRPATDAQIQMVLKQYLVTLGPGETVSRDVEVWGSNQNDTDECLVPGRYRFEESYDLPEGETLDWGFTLRVEEP